MDSGLSRQSEKAEQRALLHWACLGDLYSLQQQEMGWAHRGTGIREPVSPDNSRSAVPWRAGALTVHSLEEVQPCEAFSPTQHLVNECFFQGQPFSRKNSGPAPLSPGLGAFS